MSERENERCHQIDNKVVTRVMHLFILLVTTIVVIERGTIHEYVSTTAQQPDIDDVWRKG